MYQLNSIKENTGGIMNPIISVFDETYNPDFSDNYFLNLYSTSDLLAYSVIDAVRKKFVVLRVFTKNDKFFIDQINDDATLKEKFKRVNIIYSTPLAVLIPSTVSDEYSNRQIFDLAFGKRAGGEVITVPVNEEMVTAMFLSSGDADLLFKLPNRRIIHPYSVLVNNVIRRSRKGPIVQCEFTNEGIIIACAVSGELKYCNFILCSEPVDFAYHVSSVYKNLDLSFVDVTLYYSGISEKSDKRLVEIQRFVRYTKPAQLQTDYLFSYRLNDTHRNFLALLFDAHHEDYKR